MVSRVVECAHGALYLVGVAFGRRNQVGKGDGISGGGGGFVGENEGFGGWGCGEIGEVGGYVEEGENEGG